MRIKKKLHDLSYSGNGKRSPPLEPTLQNSIFFKRLRDIQQYNDGLNAVDVTNAGSFPDPDSDVLSSEKKIQEVLFDLVSFTF